MLQQQFYAIIIYLCMSSIIRDQRSILGGAYPAMASNQFGNKLRPPPTKKLA